MKQKVLAHHTTAVQAGKVFSQVKPRLAVFYHIVPFDAPDLIAHTRNTYSGLLEVGEDLMTIDIGDKVVVHRAPK
jgi:ribonuclease Z